MLSCPTGPHHDPTVLHLLVRGDGAPDRRESYAPLSLQVSSSTSHRVSTRRSSKRHIVVPSRNSSRQDPGAKCVLYSIAALSILAESPSIEARGMTTRPTSTQVTIGPGRSIRSRAVCAVPRRCNPASLSPYQPTRSAPTRDLHAAARSADRRPDR